MKVELLAPAGNMASAVAAINSGCDAIYLAGPQYGARAYADNFSLDELKEVIKFAHIRDKSVFVTVNTVLFEDEIKDAIKFLEFLYLNDCDGVIVQDLGLVEIILKKYPDMPVHASTQMNIHTFSQAKKLQDLGFKRIVLARETPFEVIKEIKEKLSVEIEVFVHGALCVSYSGNCYFSSVVGKRSGNRGRCAQPCRMLYKLDDNKEKYYLSPKDLCTIEEIRKLVEIGVNSFKIEGRMKRSEYVGQVVSSYRKILDNKEYDLNKEINDLKLIFNREFTKGFLFGEHNNKFINVENQNHQGIKIGKVLSSNNNKVRVKLDKELEFGDSIRIVSSKKTDAVTINQMYLNSNLIKKAKKGDIVTFKTHENELENGDIFLTTSISQINTLQEKISNNDYIVNINGSCYAKDGKLVLEVSDGKNKVIATSEEDVVSSNNDLTERIKEQLQKTKSTIYRFKELKINLNKMMISIKGINQLRRDALVLLDEARSKRYNNRVVRKYYFDELSYEKESPKITVRVKNEEQLVMAINEQVERIYVEDYKLYQKYKDQNVLYSEARVNPIDTMNSLTSSIANLNGKYSSVYMNVNNSFAIYKLLKEGCKSVGLSIELSKDDIEETIENFESRYNFTPNLEMMVYGYYELMISKYCPIQKKYNVEKKNCNLCMKERHYLVDRMGFKFPIIKGEGCYTKILNCKKTYLLHNLIELKKMGISSFLLDFSIETGEETKEIIRLFKEGLNKEMPKTQVNDVTFGHYNEGVL